MKTKDTTRTLHIHASGYNDGPALCGFRGPMHQDEIILGYRSFAKYVLEKPAHFSFCPVCVKHPNIQIHLLGEV